VIVGFKAAYVRVKTFIFASPLAGARHGDAMSASDLTRRELVMAEPAAAESRAPDHDGRGAARLSSLDAWFATPEDPIAAHRAVLRLTYGIAPAVVIMSALTALLGIGLPLWLIAFQALVMMAASWRQERLLEEGVFTPWMPAAHLNLVLLMLTVWVAFSGGVQSPFVWVYGVVIAIYGVLWGFRFALASATLCTVYLVAVLGLMRLGVGNPVLGVPSPLLVRVFLVSYIAMFDRTRCPPWGVAGGGDGQPGRVDIVRGGEIVASVVKDDLALEPGDEIRLYSAGGGGYGNPLERPVAKVVEDVRSGYVSAESAARYYGVALDEHLRPTELPPRLRGR